MSWVTRRRQSSAVGARRDLVAWIRQEPSKTRHLWRLTNSEICCLFKGLAYPCNKVAPRTWARGAGLGRFALHPSSVPLAGADEECLVGLDHPGEDRPIVLCGRPEEGMG